MIRLILLAFLITSASCSKVATKTAELDRDCTGTYLVKGKRTYKVCNPDVLKDYEAGETIRVRMRIVEECADDGSVVCEMLRLYDDDVMVESVN